MSEPTPKGVLVIITSAKGLVQGVGSDFNHGPPGGMTQREIQEMRAEDKAWRDVVVNLCAGELAEAIMSEGMAIRSIGRKLRGSGWKLTVEAIGYEEGEE